MNGTKKSLIALGLSAVLLMGSAAAIGGGVYDKEEDRASTVALDDGIPAEGVAGTINVVENVTVTGYMTKVTYYSDEEWSIDGLGVEVMYSDSTYETIDNSLVTWRFNPATPALYRSTNPDFLTITASYGGKSGSTYLDNPWIYDDNLVSIELIADDPVTEYYRDEDWDESGFYLKLTYDTNLTRTIYSGFELSFESPSPSYNGSGTFVTTATASYAGFTASASFAITVYNEDYPYWYSYKPTESDAQPASGTSSGSFEYDGLTWNYFTEGGTVSTFDSERGITFGTRQSPCSTVTLFSEAFMGDGRTLISSITVNAGAYWDGVGDLTITVLVNGVQIGQGLLREESQDFVFSGFSQSYGSVEIVLDQSNNVPSEFWCPLYLGGIEIGATRDTTGTAIVPAIQALEEIKTCEVTAGSSSFGTYLDNYKTVVETYGSELSDIQIRDYADGDTGYSGNRTRYVNFMDKYNACYERYNDTSSSLLYIAGGGETMAAIAVAALAILLSAGAAYVIIRKKRAA